jgi:NitT/TauT family transport system substrate-binding protein
MLWREQRQERKRAWRVKHPALARELLVATGAMAHKTEEREIRMSLLSRRTLLGSAAAMVAAPHVLRAQTANVRFTLDWRFEGPAALFVHALDKGYYQAEGLNVTIDTGNGSRESIPRVASGTYDMGFGDVNSLIRFRDENAGSDVKAVMMVYDRPPFSIIGRKSRGITADVKSLEGKKFGAPAADAAFAQWPIFRTVNNLNESTMRFENVGFPVREPMLASGEVDAVFGFSNSTFINLKARGVPVDDIVMMLMADYGVELYGNVIMAGPRVVAENPDVVRRFLRAFTKGVKEVVANPAATIDSVIKRNDVARKEVETERLEMTVRQYVDTPWVKANGFGGIDPARWNRALDQIGLTFQYKDRARAGAAFNDAFLPGAGDRRIS